MNGRQGVSRLGCLVTLLIAVAVAYFGFNVGEVYLRYYRFRDALDQQAQYARSRDDDAIRLRIAALVDSLGLPDEAGRIRIRREARRVVISSRYTELVPLPGFVREFHFSPEVARPF